MPAINDSENPAASNNKLNLIQAFNTVAFILKKITGENSWKVPPSFSIAELAQRQAIQGAKGDTGAQGIQGLKGDKGDTGATGAQGIQGLKGDKGDTGATGAQGIQGLKGDKGDTGATAIVTSAVQPINPTEGLIWNEINSSNNLIETWTRLNNAWISSIKEVNFTSGSISSTVTYYFPLDSTKDVYFHSYSRFYLSPGTSSSTSYFAMSGSVYADNTVVGSNLFQASFQNQAVGQVAIVTSTINQFFVGLNTNNFRVTATRNGSPPSATFSFGIRYQYIRK